MRTFSRTNQFKKDVKRAEKRGKDMAKLKTMLERLIDGEPLPPECRRNAGITRCAEILPGAAIAISNRIGC